MGQLELTSDTRCKSLHGREDNDRALLPPGVESWSVPHLNPVGGCATLIATLHASSGPVRTIPSFSLSSHTSSGPVRTLSPPLLHLVLRAGDHLVTCCGTSTEAHGGPCHRACRLSDCRWSTPVTWLRPRPGRAQPALPAPPSSSALHLVLTRREQLRGMTCHRGLEVGCGLLYRSCRRRGHLVSPPLQLARAANRSTWYVASRTARQPLPVRRL